MRVGLAVVLLLIAAPALHAADTDPLRADGPAVVEATVAEIGTPEPATELAPVVLEEREAADRPAVDAMQEMPQRGSFWWVVGAIVVAGLILALVL